MSGTERINVGIRTFEKEITVHVLVIESGRHTSETTRVFAPHTFQQVPLRELTSGPLAADSEIRLSYAGGPVSAYHSIVQSGSNDSFVVAPLARIPFDTPSARLFHVP